MMQSQEFSQRYADEGNAVDYYFFVDSTCIFDQSKPDNTNEPIVLNADIGCFLAFFFGEVNSDNQEAKHKEAIAHVMKYRDHNWGTQRSAFPDR